MLPSCRPRSALLLSSPVRLLQAQLLKPLLTSIGRILRFLASVGQIKETGLDTYSANEETKVLAEPGYRGLIYHTFDNIGPILQALPEFLAETKYQDINDASKTAAQKAFNISQPIFSWISSQPKRFEPLQQTMTVQPRGAPWFSVVPFAEQLGSFAGPDIFVDVGGGFGHQSLELLGAYPELKGKLILQDLEQTLAHRPPLNGVKTMAHDFFTEQPVKGARFYYLRHILHDWPDDKAIQVLSRIREALGPDSQVLIDEIVMPNVGAHELSTNIDMIMMACLGAIERTVNEWHVLLEAAGFRILRIDGYFPRRQVSIIQAVPLS